MIELINISKAYNIGKPNPVKALKEITAKIQTGSMTAVVGPSGSGKSTLLNIIGLMDKMTDGTYVLDGVETTKLKQTLLSKLRNQKMGFVLQDFGLLLDRTVEENVMIPLLFAGIPFFKCRFKVLKMLESLDIADLIKRPAGELSGGQKQRTAIARALINQPSYILADEPTGSLDSKTADEVMWIFKELHGQGRTVIIVTHNDDIAKNCDEIIHLKDGYLIQQ